MPDPKTVTYIFAAVLLACLTLSLGSFLGKKFEVFRVVIFAAAVALVTIIVFAIYFAYLGISGQL
ncbi:MAG: hypothetical protein JW901_07240 [Dehalococcoidia bacterium]|nr:hypothetical protein [Dehalococcoidia bacterium]